MGDDVTLVSSAEETAKDVYRVLADGDLLRPDDLPRARPSRSSRPATRPSSGGWRAGSSVPRSSVGARSARGGGLSGRVRVTVVGCSGSFAGPRSPASCYLVQAEHEGRTWNVVLDLGAGALGTLQQHIDPRDLDAIFLSHLHPDHCIDLCGLYVVQRYHPRGPSSEPVAVYGPTGTGKRMSRGLRPRRRRTPWTPSSTSATTSTGSRSSSARSPSRRTAVHHPIEAYGLRVEADGVTLAYTGDTDECDALCPLMHDADLVLADSAFVEGRDTAPRDPHERAPSARGSRPGPAASAG